MLNSLQMKSQDHTSFIIGNDVCEIRYHDTRLTWFGYLSRNCRLIRERWSAVCCAGERQHLLVRRQLRTEACLRRVLKSDGVDIFARAGNAVGNIGHEPSGLNSEKSSANLNLHTVFLKISLLSAHVIRLCLRLNATAA